MSAFEQQVTEFAQRAVLKIIAEGSWIAPDYANRVQIPKELMSEVWAMVDREKLKTAMAARLESELADRIMNHLAAEIATDVKQLLSVKERREALRSIARDHIESITKLGGGP